MKILKSLKSPFFTLALSAIVGFGFAQTVSAHGGSVSKSGTTGEHAETVIPGFKPSCTWTENAAREAIRNAKPRKIPANDGWHNGIKARSWKIKKCQYRWKQKNSDGEVTEWWTKHSWRVTYVPEGNGGARGTYDKHFHPWIHTEQP